MVFLRKDSMLNKLFETIRSLIVLAILGWIGWYAWSQWKPTPSATDETVPGASFNCRKALADLATDYACRDSASCEMTEHELTQIEKLETNISMYCD